MIDKYQIKGIYDMRLFFSLYVLIFIGIPLHAQSNVYSQNLSALDIEAIQLTRLEDNSLILEIEGTSDLCGEIIISEWYTEVMVDSLSEPLAGDSRRSSSGQQYANISIFILPEDDSTCDLETQHTISIEMPITIDMVHVPDYRDGSFQDTVLLVNDFTAWFYLVDEDDVSSSNGQAIDIGETALIRWQKIDSILEELYSVGASGGSAIPWIQGYHPDGCEAVSHVNIIINPVESNHYTINVFRLLPIDTICSASIQPFILTATGVVPQSDIILNLAEMSYRIFIGEGVIGSVQRRYPTIISTDIQVIDEGFRLQLTMDLSENCDVPISIEQVTIDNISFLNMYYDVAENLICADEEIILEESILIPSLPIVINGIPVFE